jgi:hypothetical protein
MHFTSLSRGTAVGVPTHWGVFPHKRAPLTIPPGEEEDVEVLGWCGYTWSALVRPVAKFSKMTLEVAFGR